MSGRIHLYSSTSIAEVVQMPAQLQQQQTSFIAAWQQVAVQTSRQQLHRLQLD